MLKKSKTDKKSSTVTSLKETPKPQKALKVSPPAKQSQSSKELDKTSKKTKGFFQRAKKAISFTKNKEK